jgi:Transposase
LAGAFARTDRPAGARVALEVIATYIDCPVPEVARLARTLRTWQPQLQACFGPEGISNGPTEAVNLLIENVRRVGHGYRKVDNYRLRLLLHCGITWDKVFDTTDQDQHTAHGRVEPLNPEMLSDILAPDHRRLVEQRDQGTAATVSRDFDCAD